MAVRTVTEDELTKARVEALSFADCAAAAAAASIWLTRWALQQEGWMDDHSKAESEMRVLQRIRSELQFPSCNDKPPRRPPPPEREWEDGDIIHTPGTILLIQEMETFAELLQWPLLALQVACAAHDLESWLAIHQRTIDAGVPLKENALDVGAHKVREANKLLEKAAKGECHPYAYNKLGAVLSKANESPELFESASRLLAKDKDGD